MILNGLQVLDYDYKMLKSSGRSLDHNAAFKTEDEAKRFQEFYFIQAADTQLGLMYNWGTNGEDGVKYPASNWDKEMELCKKSVEILNSLSPPPAFFIVCLSSLASTWRSAFFIWVCRSKGI